MPLIKEIARKFEKSRMLMRGGVLAKNIRAIHFYEKYGFQQVGTLNQDSNKALDMIVDR